MDKRIQLRNAVFIGATCIVTYITYYFLKNMLGTFTPQMTESGEFTKNVIAVYSSVYMISYAAGQFVNGLLGDMIRPRYMVLCGLSLAGASMIVFATVGANFVRIICFLLLGLGVSMLRGPLVKVFSENNPQNYARIISVIFSFVFFVGPLIAGLLALWMKWNAAFIVSGIVAFIMAVSSFLLLTLLEKRGIIKFEKKSGERKKFDIVGIFKLKYFVPFLLIELIGEISGTSIVFWVPTYITEHLGFDANVSGIIASILTFAKTCSPFVGLGLYKLFKENAVRMVGTMFGLGALLYAVMIFVSSPIANLVLFAIAITATGIASTTVWSIYVPSLAYSGKVSSANGILDCSGYIAASLASLFFAFVMEQFDFGAMILVWAIIMGAGTVITVISSRKEA